MVARKPLVKYVICGTPENWEKIREKYPGADKYHVVPADVYVSENGFCLLTSKEWNNWLLGVTSELPDSSDVKQPNLSLKEFVSKYTTHNSLIRLWTRLKDGYHAIVNSTDERVGRNWGIINGDGWQAKYADCEVVGVTDIWVCDDTKYSTPINIVIKVEED